MKMEKRLGDEVDCGLVYVGFSGSLTYRGDPGHEVLFRGSLTWELKSSHDRPGDKQRTWKSQHKGLNPFIRAMYALGDPLIGARGKCHHHQLVRVSSCSLPLKPFQVLSSRKESR